MAVESRQAERVREVEERSAVLHRQLGLTDLVLIQILYVVGTNWVGTAAKLGPSHVVFWTLAALTFYLPQAAVVIFLNRLMPLEGGPYQWATVGLGEFFGFLVAWNLWASGILLIATFSVITATNLSYLAGPWAAWLTGTSWYTSTVSLALIGVIAGVSVRGLGVAKWVQNAGGVAQFLTFGALIAIPFVALWRGTLHSYHPLAAAAPGISLLSLNIFGKLAVGAFSGFEYVALMFVLGTSSILALVPGDQIDLVSPTPRC